LDSIQNIDEGEEPHMYTLKIRVSIQCPDRLTEMPVNDLEHAELAVEDSVSLLLMELFGGTILVDDVTVQYASSEYECGNHFPCCA
jgi:hypothetical protein